MTDGQIWETISRAMIEEFELDPEKVKPQAAIKDDLGLDSLDVVDMVIVLETAFDFKIHDKSALAEIITMADVTEFITRTVELEEKKVANG